MYDSVHTGIKFTLNKDYKMERNRCSDEKFLEAVYSSSTYAEIAEKTGQKISSTMARYAKTKKKLAEYGIELPKMKRKQIIKSDSVEQMVSKAKLLQQYYA
jgi:hypothetical protein